LGVTLSRLRLDYECGYFGHYDDYAPLPHYDYSPHFSGDGYYHHNMLSPSHSHAPQPLTSAPFTPHSKTRASRNSLVGFQKKT